MRAAGKDEEFNQRKYREERRNRVDRSNSCLRAVLNQGDLNQGVDESLYGKLKGREHNSFEDAMPESVLSAMGVVGNRTDLVFSMQTAEGFQPLQQLVLGDAIRIIVYEHTA